MWTTMSKKQKRSQLLSYQRIDLFLSFIFIESIQYQTQYHVINQLFISQDYKEYSNYSANIMKQSSLLQSFIQRQKNKEISDSKIVNKQEKQDSSSNQESHQKRKNKKMKRSDDQYEQQDSQYEQIEKNFEDLEISEGAQQKRKSKRVRKEGKSKSKSKSKKKQRTNTAPKRQENSLNRNENPFDQFTDATPIWAQKQHCLDKMKRSPKDPNYDPSTLYVPEEAWSKFTVPTRQFWKIKSDNFDKVILFKLGKFYELFYDDAAIGNKYLNLKFMGTKMHTGFPEKCLEKYSNELVELGFKVVIVQQMETPEQMQQRVNEDKKKGRKSEKAISRQVTQILTKGTFINHSQKQAIYLPNYLLSIRTFGEAFGFSLLQISTNEIIMGVLDSLQKFKTLLFQTRPVELVYDPDNINIQLAQMMQKSFLSMQMSKIINKNNIWHPLNALGELDILEKQGKINKNSIFQIINGYPDLQKNLIYSTLSGLFDYLKKILKFQYVIGTARFSFYEKDAHCKNMILDSQALQHLQIFETPEGTKGSLFQIIDKTRTKFGRRLLRKWLMSPLLSSEHINQRLNAIEDIQKLRQQKQQICQILKKLPDLDKKINKLYHYAIKTTSASKAVYFQDLNTARLKEFRQVMEKMEEAWDVIQILGKNNKKLTSTRLRQLILFSKHKQINQEVGFVEDENQLGECGLLPDVISHLSQFKTYIKWQGNVPIPQKGLVSHFDELQVKIGDVKNTLQKYIDKIRYEMNEPNLKFAHTKQRYQIEVPQRADKRKPRDFQFSSKKAGFSRYICPQIKMMVKNLQKIEEELKQQMGLFIGFFFQQFKKKQKVWQRYVEILAEIDCLISLSEYSFLNDKVRPKFDQNIFQIRGAKHPCLIHIEYIPNDIIMKKKVMLLTGPNMGGKSTLLRTVCCLAILAQIGSFVPAEYYNCELVDRIFTRIGASDMLELGKSTFFIEMQETKNVLQYGSSRSIAIIDQLGRGTSTFDGMAIAYSVLKHIIQRLKCYCFFATHYHILIEEFKDKKEVRLMMMDSILKANEIIFLYKLVPGNVEKSFGLNVAQKVGVSEETTKVAGHQADKMNKYIEGKRRDIYHKVVKFIKQK